MYGKILDSSGPPISGATVEIASGPDAGHSAQTDTSGSYSISSITAGSFAVRVTKTGFDTLQQDVTFSNLGVSYRQQLNLSLVPATACVSSVNPAFIKYFPSAGGTAEVQVQAPDGREWFVTTVDAWLHILTGASGSGSGTIRFASDANPETYGTDFRKGTLSIGCSNVAGRDVSVWQVPNCRASAGLATPNPFPASGGNGRIRLLADSPFTCPWQAVSQVDWITMLKTEGAGDYDNVSFTVAPNTTGADRTGTVVVAEKIVTIIQKG